MRHCSRCGKDNEDDSAFCVYCGYALLEQETEDEEEQEDKKEVYQAEDVGSDQNEKDYLENQAQGNSESSAEEAAVVYEVAEQHSEVGQGIQREPEYIETTTVDRKKKRWIIWLAIVVVLIGLIGGTGYYFWEVQSEKAQYAEDYQLNGALGFNYATIDDLGEGELFFQPLGKEKQLIASEVSSYVMGSQSDWAAYVDKDGNLFTVKMGASPKKISTQVNAESLELTENEKQLLFASDSEEQYVYTLSKEEKSKLSDQTNGYFDEESGLYYYIKDQDVLYKTGPDLEAQKISEGIWDYKVLDSSYFLCWTSEKKYALIKGHDPQIKKEEMAYEDIDLSNCQYDKESQLLLFMGQEEGQQNSGLYIKLPNQQGIKIADKVILFNYYPASKQLYYLTEDQQLVTMTLPKVNKKAKSGQAYFNKVLKDCKKVSRLSSCIGYTVSPDGKAALAYDTANNMYLLKKDEKQKLAANSQQSDIFNDYLYYVTQEGALFVQKGLDGRKLADLEKPEQLSGSVEGMVTASEYGKYLAFFERNGDQGQEKIRLMRYERDKDLQVMMEDAEAFDVSTFIDNTHERMLKYQEIEGSYYCNAIDCLFKFGKDKKVSVYCVGTCQGEVTPEFMTNSRNTMSVVLQQDGDFSVNTDPTNPGASTEIFDQTCAIQAMQNGVKKIELNDGTVYELTEITDKEFDDKLEAQKAAEEERQRQERIRQEEERRRREEEERQRREQERIRQQLNSTAQSYYYYGAYVPADTYIYDSTDYSSRTSYYTLSGSTWRVQDYWIDYDASVIWIKVYYTPSFSYERTGWMPISQ